jgi:hypothetical protein
MLRKLSLQIGVTVLLLANSAVAESRLIQGPDARNYTNTVSSALQGIGRSEQMLRSAFGISHPGIDVYLSDDPNWMADQYLRTNRLGNNYRSGKVEEFRNCIPAGEGSPGGVFLCESDSGYNDEYSTIRITAHEMWHGVVQYALTGKRCCTESRTVTSVFGPNWLIEGSAELFAEVVMANGNLEGLQRAMRHYRSRTSPSADLMQMRSRADFSRNAGWDAGPLAVYLLTDEGKRLDRLVTFYQAIAAGKSTRRSFEDAFGRSERDFAVEFRNYLRQ